MIRNLLLFAVVLAAFGIIAQLESISEIMLTPAPPPVECTPADTFPFGPGPRPIPFRQGAFPYVTATR